ncbi:MAG: GDSL-type esterase/lipase family protein [Desulfobulbaceae bacterium]|nr:GDSL-type esterase/lipase family protein [Desulfobulbaceae bacterium]
MANLFLIGDSMIEFFDWRPCFPDHRVVNLGRSGETTAELLARLPAILALQPAPDWLLLMTGTNDVCMEHFAFPATYARILATCKTLRPQAEITVNSLLPIALPYLAADTVPRLNGLLRALTSAPKTHFLDGYAALSDRTGKIRPGVLAADGVHLSDHGYQLWGNALQHHLSSLPL